MTLNRDFLVGGLIVAVYGILLVASQGCANSSLRETSLSYGDRDSRIGQTTAAEGSSYANKSAAAWHESFEDARIASTESGKPILADFTGSDWCQPCIRLKKNVFESQEFKTWAQENVTLLELDYPQNTTQSPMIKKQNSVLAERYNIQSYPTILFLDPQGEVLGKLGYEDDPAVWISSADEILSK